MTYKNKICLRCGLEYSPNSPIQKYCASCKLIAYKAKEEEYYQRPDVKVKYKKYRKEYQKTPKFKSRRKERRQKPENKAHEKKYQQEYSQRPEVKAKQKEYIQKLEVKARRREHDKKRRQKPEFKERKRRYSRRPYVQVKRKEYIQKLEVKARTRDAHLKRKYNFTLEKENKMLKKQGGTCEICRKGNGKMRLFMDHNHETGKVRGLLCINCNSKVRILEKFNNNLNLFKMYIKYLEKYGSEIKLKIK